MTNVKKTTSTAKKTPVKKTTTNKRTTKKTDVPKIQKVELTTITPQKKKQELKEKETNAYLTVLGIVVLAIVAILIFGLTYAYFTATLKDMNPNNPDANIVSADLLVRYQDGESNIELGDKIEPGDILTKEFSVINEGNDTGMYTIALENIKHNLGHKETIDEKEVLYSDITYKLIKIATINDLETETVIGTGTLPFESGENTDAFKIYTKDEVTVDTTNKYRLELTYVNHLSIDQSDSMGESLELKVNIIEYDGEERTQDTEY